MIDLRSDLMTPRTKGVADAMEVAVLRHPAMTRGEDPDERALAEALCAELGVDAVLLVPTCTMANQIAIRLSLPGGGVLASGPLAHVITVEARATNLTGIVNHTLSQKNGHPAPAAVKGFLAERTPNDAALVWLENTHMFSAGSVMPEGWQSRIGQACRAKGVSVHLDGSRIWNAAVAQEVPMVGLTAGADTISISLNKGLGAPLGAILAGSCSVIEEAAGWRDAMGGGWRPIGPIAAAALTALAGWRDRLTRDMETTQRLTAAIVSRLGEDSVQSAPTNLIFLNRHKGDAAHFVDLLAEQDVHAIMLGPTIVRLAIHNGVGSSEVALVAAAIGEASTAIERSEPAGCPTPGL